MKKIHTLLLILISLNCFSQITSVANGLFYYPTTWSCMCVPTSGTDNLVINHAVTLNNDLQLLAGGSITINNGASLLQNAPRDFFLNGGNFSNHGSFSIDRLLAQSGTFTNSGTADIRTFASYLNIDNSGIINNCDSLYNNGNLTNTGIIDVGTFYNDNLLDNYGTFPAVDSLTNAGTLNNHTGAEITVDSMTNTGTFTNDGTINDFAFYNIGNFTNNFIFNFTWLTNAGFFENNGNMSGAQSLWNNENFTNQTTGTIHLNGNFYNGDTLNFDAVFTNNGSVSSLSWFNTDAVAGLTPGNFTAQDSTANVGSMTGSFDFCDLTPTALSAPFLDFNSGTVDNNITWCITVSQSEMSETKLFVYPNPANDVISISSMNSNYLATIFDYSGRKIFSVILNGTKNEIDVSLMPQGIYIVRVEDENKIHSVHFLVAH